MSDIRSFQDHISFIRSQTEKGLSKIPLRPNLTNYFYEPIKYVLKGKGKRLRPILVHLTGQIYNAHPDELMKAGIAVELLHNFSLVHDDIMDNDSKRHGQPSVHNKWDTSTAILAGDGLFALAQLSLAGLKPVAYQRFNEVALEVCEGQGIDKEYENNTSITMDEYIQMIGKKTASFLGLCAELGGLLGSASQKESNNLFQFGYNLGLAFQIKDDYLEIFGDEKIMGKSLGSDLDEQKQTVMTITARKKDFDNWSKFIQKKNNLSQYKDYFETSGIKKEVENLIESHVSKALSGLDLLSKNRSNHLSEYAKLILNRDY